MNLNQLALKLHEAFLHAKAVEQINSTRKLSLEEAYAIQGLLISKRFQQGSSYHGIKMGFTSKAKMEQMGVHELIWGILTEDMEIADNGTVDRNKFIHPRVEPEIAFKLGRNLNTSMSKKEIVEAVNGVAIALEIIDSRYQNFKFSLEDVIADNCSSAGYCVGEWSEGIRELSNLEMKVYLDDDEVSSGISSAILGDPWNSLFEAVKITHKYGHQLRAGDVVLAGAAAPAIFIQDATEVRLEVKGWNAIKFEMI